MIPRPAGHGLVAGLLLATGACGGAESSRTSHPDRLLVASGFTDQVFVLSARDGAVLDSVALDPRREERDEPHGLALAPDGSHWYASVSHGEASIWKFEIPSNRLVGRMLLPTPGAARIGIDPDGSRAFVPDYWRGGMGRTSRVAVIRLDSLTLEDAVPVCAAPHDAAVSPDGTAVVVACALNDEVVILDAETREVRRRIPAGPEPGPPGQPRYRPLNAVWSADGRRFYVTMHLEDAVRRYSAEGDPAGTTPVGARPAQVAITPDGRTLITANRGDGTASLVELESFLERLRVDVGGSHPHGVAVGQSSIAYVAFEGEVGTAGGVAALDTRDGTLLWRREVGSYTLGVLFLPAT